MTPTLADLSRSAAASLGVPDLDDMFGLGSPGHVVLCLIDGLGYLQLRDHPDIAPVANSIAGSACLAAFPSTTPVGLATMGTGSLPGQHGFLGGTCLLPETGRVLNPLHWGSEPSAIAVQPEPTIFEMIAGIGVSVASIGPAAYAHSGLTRAVLRGSDYVGAESIQDRRDCLRRHILSHDRTFNYVYWPHLDRLGHEFGVGSQEWVSGLREVDCLLASLIRVLEESSAGAVLLVTSDHGMLNTAPADRVALESHASLREDVVHIAGEPRMRHVYCRAGTAAEVQDRWSAVLGSKATVMSREQASDDLLFGVLDPMLAERVGDVIAIAQDTVVLASKVDPLTSRHIGQHGGLSDAEMLVPALIHRNS